MIRGKEVLVLTSALLILVTCAPALADGVPARPTFTKDIVPLFQRECQSCHRLSGANLSGMIAPMPLMTYEQVRPWAKAIAKSVNTKDMPPWGASPIHNGTFENERVLTSDEIATIVKWVKTGALRGRPQDAPAPVEFSRTGWSIGEPDLVVAFDEANWVADSVEDLYQNITVQISEEDLPESKWLKAIEFKPGSEAVHHIIAYSAGGDESGAMTRGMLGGEAPGTDPATFPEGYGILVPKNASITFQMHYHKEAGPGTGLWDMSSFALKFHDKPVTHPLSVSAIAHGDFEIPPRHPYWKVGGARTFAEDTTILAYMPHLHLRGKEAKYTAYYPDGTSEILLHVPEYDFNWQISYEYKELKRVPAGTRIEFEMWYDNSAERAEEVGFNGNRAVSFGGPTTDEMDLGWLTYTNTQPREVISTAAGD